MSIGRSSRGGQMRAWATLTTIFRCACVHVGMAAWFAASWFLHSLAWLRMEGTGRQFLHMDDRTLKAMALIDWVQANAGLAIGYAALAFVSIAFLQVRGRPAWTWWLTAAVYAIPCMLYWVPCARVAVKFF